MDIAKALHLPEYTVDALHHVSLPECSMHITDWIKNQEAFQNIANLNNGLVILRLYLAWTLDTKTRYDALGIPESVFWDSMKDITIWTEDYWNKHGIPGFAEWEWVLNTLRMKVFRIGRLQFEPSSLKETVLCGDCVYPAGTPVLEVHIPAGEPLDAAAVAESLQNAPAFFQTYFHREFSLFHCHSWLLSPQLKNLLPEQSRILQFQNLFTVYNEDQERQAEERVFGYLSNDANLYPENTTLQRSLKDALLDGKTVGMGLGIRVIPS